MKVQLDVISDPICPWCLIGKARLDAAIEAHGSNPFDIRWRPFQLNPTMPPEGMERQEYLNWKFGGAEAAARIYGSIEAMAEESGVEVNFAAITRTPNTVDAHRVIRWAGPMGVQSAVKQELLERYFQRGEDVGDHAILAEAAEAAGMERDVVARLLEGDADRAEVIAEDEQARAMGVNGVPTFILAGQYVLTGAQDTDVWLRVIKEIEAQLDTVEA